MALLQVNFMSGCLMRTTTMNVILPADQVDFSGHLLPQSKPFPTLYLLHGIFGNYTDWVNGTLIQRWAEKKGLAVVMPSGDNKHYVDLPAVGDYYGEFIGRELVEITRRMFPLSHRREDTFIGGLSMGGYGALRNGLKYHETFGRIAALSSSPIIDSIPTATDDALFRAQRKSYLQAVLGDLDAAQKGDLNPHVLLRQIPREKLPRVYLACGAEDSLLPTTRKLRDTMTEVGADLTYEEAPGAHEWDFWNSQIKKVLDWLPLGENQIGASSGNVGNN